ncbi:Dual specificity mitogen-activated protein kinase kinase 5 [Geodia barretti]|nr:Dual specificity mitogen-activated protein kinase kinase 5 [Geodia barretti]
MHSRSGSFRRANEKTALVKLISEGQITRQDLQYLEILGHGNGGTVYRTFHQPSKVIMAVKVIALDATQEEQRQIMAELDILHKCDSSYIIGFYGAFFAENRISICAEYMDGGSLDGYGAIPEPVLGRIIVGVVKGLNYLWSLKIMHRDIKPSNVLVNTQGCVKLCDFGVSVQLLTSLTKTFIGTNAYMAPERILGGEYGIHSEIWSLGLSTLEMALGRFPYLPEGSKPSSLVPFELLQCIVNEKPPTLSLEHFSPSLIEFTQQCMQKLPKARPGITALLQHPFLLHYDDGGEEVIAVWVRRLLEQMRIMQRFPSDTSLASTSSSVASGWSGTSLGRSISSSGGTGGQSSKFGGTIPAGSSLAPHHHLPPAPHIPPGTGSTVGHAPSSSHHHPLMDIS